MPLRIYATAIVALAILLAGTVAEAAAAPSGGGQVVASKHKRKKCKRGYHRVKRHGKRVCAKRRHKLPIKVPRTVRLQAHLSPTVKRNPLNPYEVTYDISASATAEEIEAARTVSEPTAPPDGVLALYSDGILECAVNVGPETIGDECPVVYDELGAHRVTTIYTAGTVSATDTRLQQIDPIATTTTLGLTYEASDPREYSPTKKLWRIGTLTATAGVQPAGSVTLSWCRPGCGSGTPSIPGDLLASKVSGAVHLAVWAKPPTPVSEHDLYTKPCDPEEVFPEVGIEGQSSPLWSSASAIETGQGYLYAGFAGSNGYSASAADITLTFAPNGCDE
jgi:hypothetical protein